MCIRDRLRWCPLTVATKGGRIAPHGVGDVRPGLGPVAHAGVDHEEQIAFGITDALVRPSVGVENAEDLWWDLEQALEKVQACAEIPVLMEEEFA